MAEIEEDKLDCACLARFLAAAFVCQPQEQALGGLKKRSLTALLDCDDRCQNVVVGRFLASASERRLTFCKVHQLFSILPDATEMVGL